MSALGQKRTSRHFQSMSALPAKADTGTHSRDVCFVPKEDIRTRAVHGRNCSLDHGQEAAPSTGVSLLTTL